MLTVDFRGRGYSDYDPNWQNYNPLTYVADVWTLLDLLHINRIIVVGTSLGGLCAMVMAAQHSERVAGVVMNDIGPEIDPVGLADSRSTLADCHLCNPGKKLRRKSGTSTDIGCGGWVTMISCAWRVAAIAKSKMKYHGLIWMQISAVPCARSVRRKAIHGNCIRHSGTFR